MADFRVTIEDGDLAKAHRALAEAGVGRGWGPIDTGYTDSEGERVKVERLVFRLDADDEADAEGSVTAVLPQDCRIVSVEAL